MGMTTDITKSPADAAAIERLSGLAREVVAGCRARGASQSEVSLSDDEGLAVNVRLGEVETVERTRDRAILAGDNSNRPQLLYLKPGLSIEVGDRVITSGDGGAFPPGLPVGVIDRISDGVVSVAPFVDWDHMEFLQIVDYGLDGVLGDEPVAPTANPSAGGPAASRTLLAPPRGP